MTFSALIEPTILFVTFAVALITTTDLPYAEAAAAIRPAHLLAVPAFFLVVLQDTGRIPVETHTSTLEFGMIDEARTLEHSGPALALLKWGSNTKQLILYVLLLNVFAVPWVWPDPPTPATSPWPSSYSSAKPSAWVSFSPSSTTAFAS